MVDAAFLLTVIDKKEGFQVMPWFESLLGESYSSFRQGEIV